MVANNKYGFFAFENYTTNEKVTTSINSTFIN